MVNTLTKRSDGTPEPDGVLQKVTKFGTIVKFFLTDLIQLPLYRQ
jgi:hypothetical protein